MSDRPIKEAIITYSGKAFWPFAPKPQDIDRRDIAHALSNVARYTGHTSKFYSVAEHSLLVCNAVRRAGGSANERRWALIHDASEAYLTDLARPVKNRPEFASYLAAEDHLQRMIAERFGLSPDMPAIVAEMDHRIIADEAKVFFSPVPSWWRLPEGTGLEPMGWLPAHAQERWNWMFDDLFTGRE